MQRLKMAVLLAVAMAAASASSVRRDPQADIFLAKNDRSSPIDPKIVGGEEASLGQFPWMVALRIDGRLVCGGSIVSEDLVLTSASCCEVVGDKEVLAGTLQRSGNNGGQSLNVVRETMHHKYDSGSIRYNACILELDGTFDFDNYVQAIPLAAEGEEWGIDGEIATISGWGTLSDDDILFTETLHFVEVPLLSQNTCERKTFYGDAAIDDEEICAGEEGKDFCRGDFGGPLTCNDNTVHCGIASSYIICAAEGLPGVYAETAYMYDLLRDFGF